MIRKRKRRRLSAVVFVAIAIPCIVALFVGRPTYRVVYATTEDLPFPRLVDMLILGKTDEDIMSEIDLNPSLVNEEASGSSLDYRTPVLAALFGERYELLHYMFLKGADVERNIDIIDERKDLGRYSRHLRKLYDAWKETYASQSE